MDNQEAIEILKIERGHMIPTLFAERIEAMDMAISALQAQDAPDTNVGKIDRYGYIGIETLLNFCVNSKDHAVTSNDFMRMKRVRMPEICEDAVSRRRLLNDLKELIAAWKKYPVMAEQIKGVETAIGYVEGIPSVTPKREMCEDA